MYSVMTVTSAKRTELIEMPFEGWGGQTYMSTNNHVRWGKMGTIWRIQSNDKPWPVIFNRFNSYCAYAISSVLNGYLKWFISDLHSCAGILWW